MEVQAYIKYIRISPRKLRFLMTDVRSKTPQQALMALSQSRQRSAALLYKALKSAISNATNNHKLDESSLRFKMFAIEEGPRLRRMRPASKGRGNLYHRRSAHIKVILTATKTLPVPVKESAPAAKKKK